MTTYSLDKLSASSNGRRIQINSYSSPGTLIHTAVSGGTDWDEIWIHSPNYISAYESDKWKLVIEWGDTATNTQIVSLNDGGMGWGSVVVPGLLLNNGKTVAAWLNSGSSPTYVYGYIVKIRA